MQRWTSKRISNQYTFQSLLYSTITNWYVIPLRSQSREENLYGYYTTSTSRIDQSMWLRLIVINVKYQCKKNTEREQRSGHNRKQRAWMTKKKEERKASVNFHWLSFAFLIHLEDVSPSIQNNFWCLIKTEGWLAVNLIHWFWGRSVEDQRSCYYTGERGNIKIADTGSCPLLLTWAPTVNVPPWDWFTWINYFPRL